jgi:hypothetical protein
VESYSCDKVSFVHLAWYVSGPWYKDSSLCIWCSKNDWQLGVVDPTSLPIDSGLGCREPWVS